MTVAYDAGVLVAAERGDRRIWADHRVRLEQGRAPVTTAPVVAQVSRSPRQAQLRRLLRGCHVMAFSAESAHEIGALAGASATSDVVDAHLVLIAVALAPGGVLTSDQDELRRLVSHVSSPVPIIGL